MSLAHTSVRLAHCGGGTGIGDGLGGGGGGGGTVHACAGVFLHRHTQSVSLRQRVLRSLAHEPCMLGGGGGGDEPPRLPCVFCIHSSASQPLMSHVSAMHVSPAHTAPLVAQTGGVGGIVGGGGGGGLLHGFV